jgi:hypothetical protein
MTKLITSPRQVILRACAIAVTVLGLASISLADNAALPDLRPLDLRGWGCLTNTGGTAHSPDHIWVNRMKNRDWTAVTATNIAQWDYDEFVAHARAFDAELGAVAHRSNLTAEARVKLQTIETQIVAVTGWMVLTYPGPPESCNCGSAEYHDWHIEIVPKPLDHAPRIGDPTAVICEITPRTEEPMYEAGIHLQRLAEFMNQGRQPNIVPHVTGSKPHRVRITGYLMWDDQHTDPGKDVGPTIENGGCGEYHHPWRVTAWEIHPILKIEDLGPAEW